MTVLAALNVRLVLHRYLNTVADIIFTLSLYWMRGQDRSIDGLGRIASNPHVCGLF